MTTGATTGLVGWEAAMGEYESWVSGAGGRSLTGESRAKSSWLSRRDEMDWFMEEP